MQLDISKLNKDFIIQHGQSDCGPACLMSIIHYHGGSQTLDEIRNITGTTQTGTKLLGLYQGASSLGFEVAGMQAEGIHNLKEVVQPAILHVIIEERLQHYVVFYGFQGDKLIIGDPAKGISLWDAEELDKIWVSKSLLSLEPNNTFVKATKEEGKGRYDYLISWVKEDINILVAALFLGVLIAVMSMSTAIFSQKLIDVILPTKEISKLVVGLCLFAFILVIKSGLSFIRSTFLITQSKDFNNRMIQSFFQSLLSLPKPFFDSKKVGDMVARMNDTRKIQLAISNLVGNMIIEILVVTVSVVGVYIYSWEIGITVSIFLPIYGILLWKFNKPIIASQKDAMQKYALNESNYIDVITGIAEIKATNTNSLFNKSTSAFYQAFQESIFRLGKIQISFNVGTEILGATLLVCIIALSSYLVITGELMLGVMMAVLSLSGSIGPSLTRIALFNIQLQEAKVAFRRMEEFTSLDPENAVGNSQPIQLDTIKVEDLSFSFPGSLPLLQKVNFNIQKGAITALIGESGTGKSTLMQLIQRFYKPTEGVIRVNDIDSSKIALSTLRQRLGIVPQDVKIFNHYLLFNIALSEDPKELEKVPAWCQANGFDQFFSKFPRGYATLLGEEGTNISGGQKQLVGLARALYRQPDILLVDEGTSAMDKKTEGFILEKIKEMKQHMGILMITHRMRIAHYSDYVYLLENKKLILQNKTDNSTIDDEEH